MPDPDAILPLVDAVNEGAAIPPTDPELLAGAVETLLALPPEVRESRACGLGAASGAGVLVQDLAPEVLVGLLFRSIVAVSLLDRGFLIEERKGDSRKLYSVFATIEINKDDFAEAVGPTMITKSSEAEAAAFREEVAKAGGDLENPTLVPKIRSLLQG